MTSIYHKIEELKSLRQPFAVATVIVVRGSASAKPGSKAIINADGHNVLGWVGGGCAESYVGAQAQEAMQENQSRVVTANLDDEIFGLGMPCGGVMEVFIEPHLPTRTLSLPQAGRAQNELKLLAESYDFVAEWTDKTLEFGTREQLVVVLARAIAAQRGKSLHSLKVLRGVFPEKPRAPASASFSELLILGNSRITEELASLGAFLNWPTRVFGPRLQASHYPTSVKLEPVEKSYDDLEVKPKSLVVVASHHKGDHLFMQKSLAAQPRYVGLIASPKRSGLVFDYLLETGLAREQLSAVFAPSGLDLGCLNPREIALSAVVEMIEVLGFSDTIPC